MNTYFICLLCMIASQIVGIIAIIRFRRTIKTAVVIYTAITWLLCVALHYYRFYGFSITLAVVHLILNGIALFAVKPSKPNHIKQIINDK